MISSGVFDPVADHRLDRPEDPRGLAVSPMPATTWGASTRLVLNPRACSTRAAIPEPASKAENSSTISTQNWRFGLRALK